MMSARAKKWHREHRLPKGATEAQRLAWHLEHQQMCGCRPVPASLRARNESSERKPRRERSRRKTP